MTEISELFSRSEQSFAAYADLVEGATASVQNLAALTQQGSHMIDSQADNFASRFTEVMAISDDPLNTGFSATVFSTSGGINGQLTLAIRGTDELIGSDGDDDAGILFNGIASEQVVEMFNWWKRITVAAGVSVDQVKIMSYVNSSSSVTGAVFLYDAPHASNSIVSYYMEPDAAALGTGELFGRADQRLVITGHSLGGHLAMAFEALFPNDTEAVTVFNAPGFGTGAISQSIFQALGGAVPSGGVTTNVVADEASNGNPAWSAIAALHGRLGSNVDVPIENQLLAGEPNPESLLSGKNHSLKILTDSLAVYNLLGQLDPTLSEESYDEIFQASSNEEYKSLESILDSIFNILGSGISNLPSGNDQREALYVAINDIQESATFQSLVAGDITVDGNASVSDARSDFGVFLSLIHLSPLIIHATNTAAQTALENVNSELAAIWLADQSLPDGERTYTDHYLNSRAVFLNILTIRNMRDINSDESTIPSLVDTAYIDAGGEIVTTGSTTSLFIPTTTRRSVFGDASRESLVGGDADDKLFGQAGNDTLTGGQGDDLLEGGAGADQFVWNTGDGDDVIGDYDDGGDRIIVNGIDLATLSFSQTSSNSPFYTNSTNPGITLHYAGSAMEVYVGSGPDGGVITISEYSTATTANYGIALSPFYVAPPVGDDVVQILGSSNNPADNETRESAYDREFLSQRGLDWATTAIRFNAADVANYTGGSLHGTLGGTFEGGPVDDHLIGATGSNALHGWAGDDLIEGGAGSDLLEGGAGSDTLFGGAGNDLLFGAARAGLANKLDSGSAHDRFYLTQIASAPGDTNTLDGGVGNDHVSGGDYTDYIDGSAGIDYLLGGSGNDYINGGSDRDVIYGDSTLNYRYVELSPGVVSEQLEIAFADGSDGVGQYDDVLVAGAGSDTVWGELGDDVIHGGAGDDNLFGDRFYDAAYFSAELPAYSGSSPELAAHLHGDDKLYGGAGSDLLLGNGGDDFLSGGEGVDSLLGGMGNDTYYTQFGDGLDYIEDTEGTHTLVFANEAMDNLQVVFQGNQVLVSSELGQNGFYFSKEEWGNVKIALDTTETVIERSRLDTLYLDDAGNVLLTVRATDDLSEAERNEIFIIDDTNPNKPRVIVKSGADDVEIEGFLQEGGGARMRIGSGPIQFSIDMAALQIATGFDFLSIADGLIASLINFSDNIIGSSGDDRIVGSSSEDTIDGRSGSDILDGRAGNDSLDGGTGDDVLLGGEGDDELYGGAGHDRDVLNGGPGNDELNGGFGPDVYQFSAGDGQDTLRDSNGYHYFEFGSGINPTSVVLNFTGSGDSNFRLEYGMDNTVVSRGVTRAYNISELRVNGIAIPLVLRSDLLDGIFRDTRANDVFEGGAGNDTFHVSARGDNAFRFFAGDGHDVIKIEESYQATRMGEIRFSADVDLSTLSYSFLNADATITYGISDQITLDTDTVASLLDNVLGRFTLVSEADPTWIPTIRPQSNSGSLYGSYGADNIVGTDGFNVIYPGYGDDTIVAGGAKDRIVLTDVYMYQGTQGIGHKEVWAGADNDTILAPLHQGLTFHYSQGDGFDTISYDWSFSREHPYQFTVDIEHNTAVFNAHGQDTLVFDEGITLADLSFTRIEGALDIALRDESGNIRIENFFHAYDAEVPVEPLDVFALFGEGPAPDSLLEPHLLNLLPEMPLAYIKFADGTLYDMETVLDNFLEISNATFLGTGGIDEINAGDADDVIHALGGDDYIYDGGGTNTIVGGSGMDEIYLYQGTNSIDAGPGDDEINLFGGGVNLIHFGPGHGHDVVNFVAEGAVTVIQMSEGVTPEDITVTVGSTDLGQPLIITLNETGESIASVAGIYDDDEEYIYPSPGPVITEVRFFNGVVLSSEQLLALADGITGQLIEGSGGHDTLTGTQGDDTFIGGRGNDVMNGAGGDDTFIVEGTNQGRDTIVGGEGFDTIVGGNGDDRVILKTLLASYSVERIDGGMGINIVAGTNGRNQLDFSATELLNIAQIEGAAGRDTITGSQGADVIVGGRGNDTLKGEGGDDTFIIEGNDQGKDNIFGGDGFDTILGGMGDDQFVLKKLLVDSSIERIDGGAGTNTISGTRSRNILDFSTTELLNIAQIDGGAGNDVLTGSQGADVIVGGAGRDRLDGGGGSDTYLFGLGDGRDIINNYDTDTNSNDSLKIFSVDYDELWLSRKGKHLVIDVVGSDDQVKIKNWFSNDDQKLDALYAGDRVLLRNQVDLLVSAMASYDVPVGVGAIIPEQTRSTLEPVLSSVWEVALS